ncbi:hypothetical protein PG988_011395 [Apiospora saccharicola]
MILTSITEGFHRVPEHPNLNPVTDPFPDVEHNTHIHVVSFRLERRRSGRDRGWMHSGVPFNRWGCRVPLFP